MDDGYCDAEIEDILKPALKAEAVKTIENTFKSIEKDIKSTLSLNDNLNKRLKSKVMHKYVSNLKTLPMPLLKTSSMPIT